jgi:hypothetical protein
MLIVHLVPGYFAAVKSQPGWKPEWHQNQRTVLWVAALGSTILPDVDVVYNVLFRSFFNHSILWTHSLIPHLGVGGLWLVLRSLKRWPYMQTFIGLVAVGGLSQLDLDVIAHGTPLLYPFSLMMFGLPSARVVEGGVWAYLTDPIFLVEPLGLTLCACHWILKRNIAPRVRTIILTALWTGLVIFTGAFLWWLDDIQELAASVL